MEFGRLESVEGVEWSLGPDTSSNFKLLAGEGTDSNEGAPTQLRLGTARWADRSWLGTLYPSRTGPNEYLRAYSQQFRAIELNATFYHYDPEDFRRWADQVPVDFRFCPKVPQQISHVRQLDRVHVATGNFLGAVRGLGSKLGLVWLQLPDLFAPTQFRLLEEWVQTWCQPTFESDDNLAFAVEVRHTDWFGGTWFERLTDLLTESGVTLVTTDVAGRRDVLHTQLTTPRAMIRFAGNRGHDSDAQRTRDWAHRLARWSEAGLSEAYFFLHQPSEPETLPLARHLTEALEGAPLRMTVPQALPRLEQTELF